MKSLCLVGSFALVAVFVGGVRGDDTNKQNPTEIIAPLQAILRTFLAGEAVVEEMEVEMDDEEVQETWYPETLAEAVQMFAVLTGSDWPVRWDLTPVDRDILQAVQRSLRPILQAELEFVRVTCEFTPEQRPLIKAAGDAALKYAARKRLYKQHIEEIGIPLSPQRQMACDPRQVIRKKLKNALAQILTGDQAEHYQEELDQSLVNQRRSCVMETVSRLDLELRLTSEQRSQIMESLISTNLTREQLTSADWDSASGFPVAIDKIVRSQLNPVQRRVWKSAVKIGEGFFDDTDVLMDDAAEDAEPADDWWSGTASDAPIDVELQSESAS